MTMTIHPVDRAFAQVGGAFALGGGLGPSVSGWELVRAGRRRQGFVWAGGELELVRAGRPLELVRGGRRQGLVQAARRQEFAYGDRGQEVVR
ncbi:hypothetical protein AB0A77_31300 [Streptomyces varsoviensis]|uniref:hypothetical protein n=1 Tax=Streptomyces varsoviensis TaxID=67373 RepID=UPI0033F10B63